MKRAVALTAAAAASILLGQPACRRTPPLSPTAVFRIATPYELTTLDPHAENTVSNFAVLSNVFEPLVTTDAEMRVQPALAVSWQNPDPLTWVLRLRAGVVFHSGRPLQAKDVVFSLRRLLGDRHLKMRTFIQNVSEVDALDTATVRIKTTRPTRILLNKLHFALIVPEGATAESLLLRPDGTGPFRLAAWRKDKDVALQRNDAHWGGKAGPAEVRMALATTTEQAIAGVLHREYELVQEQGKAFEQRVRGSAEYTVVVHDNIYVKFVGYDLARDVTPFCPVRPNPFRRLDVRRALDAATDRPALVAGLPSHAVPANQPMPRFIFGYNPALPEARADLALARRLLAEAGLAGGFEVTLHSRRPFEEAARLLAAQWARVGVRVRVETLPEGEFFAAQDRGDLSLWITRYGCPTGDASDLLDGVIHTRDDLRHLGTQNFGRYSDPHLDRVIEQSAEIEPVNDRQRVLQAVVAQVVERRVILPLFYDRDVYAVDRDFEWRPRNDSYIRGVDVRTRAR